MDESDIAEVFVKYLEGKIPVLPWCESALQAETSEISTVLTLINKQGYLTINSQPAVNGERSDHKVFGWGGPGGRVYQKAYIEFFCSPEKLKELKERCKGYSMLSLHAIDLNGDECSIGTFEDPYQTTAVTWGVFPNREILQPTVFDKGTFEIWSKEAFDLWISTWASLYDDESYSAELIYNIYESYYLVAVVDNDYFSPSIFSLFGFEETKFIGKD